MNAIKTPDDARVTLLTPFDLFVDDPAFIAADLFLSSWIRIFCTDTHVRDGYRMS
jgi:hypothetical protein